MHAIVHLFVSRSSEAFQKMGQSNRKGKTLGLGLTACTCTDILYSFITMQVVLLKFVQQWMQINMLQYFMFYFFFFRKFSTGFKIEGNIPTLIVKAR